MSRGNLYSNAEADHSASSRGASKRVTAQPLRGRGRGESGGRRDDGECARSPTASGRRRADEAEKAGGAQRPERARRRGVRRSASTLDRDWLPPISPAGRPSRTVGAVRAQTERGFGAAMRQAWRLAAGDRTHAPPASVWTGQRPARTSDRQKASGTRTGVLPGSTSAAHFFKSKFTCLCVFDLERDLLTLQLLAPITSA